MHRHKLNLIEVMECDLGISFWSDDIDFRLKCPFKPENSFLHLKTSDIKNETAKNQQNSASKYLNFYVKDSDSNYLNALKVEGWFDLVLSSNFACI